MTNAPAVIDHAARLHSPVGGSTAERVMNCTASVNLCPQYPNIETEFAAEGTACHEAVDLILMGKTREDRDVIGVTFNNVMMTEKLFDEAIVPGLEQFDALDKELGGIDFYNERLVVFPGIENAFGTADIVGTAKDRTVVWDWKFGKGVAVEAEANEQLMYYAYAAMHTPPTDKFFHRDKPIELFICQPRVNDGEPFTRWMTTTMQLEAFALELRKAVEISQTPEATFKLGPWCKFCNAKSGCPLYQNVVTDVDMLGPDQLRDEIVKWLPKADRMIEWGESLKVLAHQLMEQGAEIPGWKLVQKRANRDWVDPDKALKYFAKVGLPAPDRHVKKIVSPKQAEDALKRNHLPAELPAALVVKASSGTTLAPESDKRPAAALPAQALKLLADRLSAM